MGFHRTMDKNRKDLQEAVRWIHRSSMWKARGFEEAAGHCADQAVKLCSRVDNDLSGFGTIGQRAKQLMKDAKRIKALPKNRDAFEYSMNAFWNGHEMPTSVHHKGEL